MNREEQLRYCRVCTKRTFNPSRGILCSLTGEEATFETTCPYFEKEENAEISKAIGKSGTAQFPVKTIVRTVAILVFVILAIVLSWGPVKRYRYNKQLTEIYSQYTEDQYRNFGRKLANLLKQNQWREFDNYVDQEYLRQRILNNVYADAASKEIFSRDIYRPGYLINLRLKICESPEVDCVHFYHKGEVPHLVIRTFCQKQINYLDIGVGVNENGLSIQDMFMFSNGMSWDEDISILINEVGGVKADKEGKSWSFPYRKMIDRFNKAEQVLNFGNVKAALKYLNEIPPQFHKYSGFQAYRIRIASKMGELEFLETAKEIEKSHPELTNYITYHKMVRYAAIGDTVNCAKAINDFREYCGNDRILSYLRAEMLLKSLEFEKYASAFYQTCKKFPDNLDLNEQHLQNCIAMADYKGAVDQIRYLRKELKLSSSELRDALMYPNYFFQSKEFMAYLKNEDRDLLMSYFRGLLWEMLDEGEIEMEEIND
ncbi:MAG: hypothetical protein GC181_12710 [Bacteroidetes bacterium]|nr:hypothetical protein [Bacteroidota bacterium]